jgi:L-2,4-diaminobutyric acid acetyltransferase
MNLTLRKPVAEDGSSIHELVRLCSPLDENSVYCNLLQASYFSESAVVAEADGKIIGFITGFISPKDPEVLFVWQVAVSPAARGLGLGLRMLEQLSARMQKQGVRFVETTITDDNGASWALFRRFAAKHEAAIEHAPHYLRVTHFRGHHETENLLRIGPLVANAQSSVNQNEHEKAPA